MTLAKWLLAQSSTESLQKAEDLLSGLHDFFASIHNTRFLLDVLTLQALLHDARGEEPAALEILTRAINLAEPGGFIRLFVDLGPKMERVQAAPDSLTVDPLSLINQSLDEPLTKREFEILSLLEQRLRNKEIAEKLFISIETVKRHTINIYGNLNVNSRIEAVDRAKALRKLKR